MTPLLVTFSDFKGNFCYLKTSMSHTRQIQRVLSTIC